MIDTFKITKKIEAQIHRIIKLALDYEEHFDKNRTLGITGELGELIACKEFNLALVKDKLNAGFDALDKDLKVQIKSARKQPSKVAKADHHAGRISRFSDHSFDYCILLIFNQNYELFEAWRANFKDIDSLIKKSPRRNPKIKDFITLKAVERLI
jgi:hypothetical protein